MEKNDNLTRRDLIAIVGMSCRFPGSANDPDQFWQLLSKGIDASSSVPRFRWDADKFYDPKVGTVGKMYTKRGYFIDAIDQFDAMFFGISGREATFMDPQQRLLLEVGWEAVERTGLSMKMLQEKKTGVYIGCMNYDYAQLVATAKEVDLHANTGTTPSALSGRMAHVFGLQGPVLTLDTACSSSLLCTHLACQSLRIGETDFALVGGVNLQLTPFTTVMECAGKMLAPDGRCKVFSDQADGFGRGDGCAVLVMMRLRDAEHWRLPIIAIIHGSAVNHDGNSGAMTVPNGKAQEQVMQEALLDSNIPPAAVSYVEAHGTGTSLGDPIEINALQQVYSQHRSKNSLYIGSVKANIGHTEATAGVASLVKTALMLQHKQLVPQLYSDSPTQKVAWHSLSIQVPSTLQHWLSEETEYYAGVSSFGLSGTNVHMILGDYHLPQQITMPTQRWLFPLCISAPTPIALSQMVKNYLMYLQAIDDEAYFSAAYTSCVGRVHFKHRMALSCMDRRDAITTLEKLLLDGIEGKSRKIPAVPDEIIVVLLQSDLLQFDQKIRNIPVFDQAIKTCQSIFNQLSTAETTNNNKQQAAVSTFTQSYAYGTLLLTLGLKPTLYLAEPVGLLAAAVLAGVLDINSAAELFNIIIQPEFEPSMMKDSIERFQLNSPTTPLISLSGEVFESSDKKSFISLFEKTIDSNTVNALIKGIDNAVVIGESNSLQHIGLCSSKLTLHKIGGLTTSDQEPSVSDQLMQMINTWHLQGYEINWLCLEQFLWPRSLLPTYAFQRNTYWVTHDSHSQWQFNKKQVDIQPVPADKGQFFQLPEGDIHYQLRLEPNSDAYWNHHRLNQLRILPGVVNIEVLISFSELFSPNKPLDILMLTYHNMAVLQDDNTPIFHATFLLTEEAHWSYKSYLYQENQWLLLASATLRAREQNTTYDIPVVLDTVKTQWKKAVEQETLYAGHEHLGYQLGKPFQWLSSGYYAEGEILRAIKHPGIILSDEAHHALYPGLIDACLQCYDSNGYESAMNVEANKIYVPFHFKKISYLNNFDIDQPAWSYAIMRNTKNDYADSSIGDIVLFQENKVILYIEGVEYRKSASMSEPSKTAQNAQQHGQKENKAGDGSASMNMPHSDRDILSACLTIVAQTMQLPKDQIDPGQLLSVMGLDSVMALEISGAISEKFGVEIPLVSLLECASVNWLARHIGEFQLNETSPNASNQLSLQDASELMVEIKL